MQAGQRMSCCVSSEVLNVVTRHRGPHMAENVALLSVTFSGLCGRGAL